MSDSIDDPRSPRDYLLVPPHPVPNGMLHLGHMAGPYLSLDFLARHRRRRGDRVLVISGSDVYEPFLTLRAEQEERDPAELAEEYHARILDDYAAFDVTLDEFLNPLAPEWAERYAEAYYEVARRLIAAGDALAVEETMCYSPERSRFVAGCWLVGTCPVCGSGSGGFTCEDCGAHYQALREPRSRRDEALVERPVENLFFRIRDPEAVLRQLEETETPAQYRRICERHLELEGRLLRLTAPDLWGLPWDGFGDGQARALVGQGFLFSYAHLCGEIFRELTGGHQNPFDLGSSTVTVDAFGIDNAVTHMVGIQATAMALEDRRPFDRFLVNHFYLLEGEKFSTSRRHVIWAGELVTRTAVTSDRARYYLALTSPTEKRENFDVGGFLEVLNERLARPWNRGLDDAFGRLESRIPAAAEEGFARRLRAGLEAQDEAFAFRSFDPRRALVPLDRWLEAGAGPGSDGAYWWLKGLALLAEPVMPGIAGELWRALGGDGRPTTTAALAPTAPTPSARPDPFAPVTHAELAPCLPDTLETPASHHQTV